LIKVFVSHATLGHALVLAGATEKAPQPTSAPTFLTKVSLESYERFDRTATVIAYDVGGLQGEEHIIGEVSFTLSEFAARSDASAANNAQAGGQPQPVEFTLQRVVEHQDGTSSREDVAGAVVRISDVTLRAGSATARGRQSAVESPRSAGADGQLADAAEGALENIQEQQQAEQIAAALNAAAAAPAAAVPEPIEASAVAPASKKGSAAGSRAASRTGSSTGAAVVAAAAAAAAAGSSSKPSSRPVSRPGSSIGGSGPKSPGSPKKTASRPGSGVKAQPAGAEAAAEQPRLSRPVSASQKLAANLEKKDAEAAAAAIAEAQARQEAATPASAVAESALSAREHEEQAHDVTAGPAAAAGATAEMPAPEAHASATAVDAAAE
jgi:hypothetical protein